MSIELSNDKGILGQFASNAGYTALIAASESNPTLKKFFADASTEDVPAVIAALKNLDADRDVLNTALSLIGLMEGQKLVFISNGTHDKPDSEVGKAYGEDVTESEDENQGNAQPEDEDSWKSEALFIKLDDDKHLVFGWFSIVEIAGKAVVDTQGDIITPETIEESAYDFVLNARKGGEMHRAGDNGIVRGIGRLVESVVFTKEKQKAMLQSLLDQHIDAELSLGCVCWWGGFSIDNPDTWAKIKSGELKAFSIGGKGKRAAI